MPTAELIERLEQEGVTVNQAHRALEELGLTDDQIPDDAYDRVKSHLETPPTKKAKSKDPKGALTTANQNVGKAAIASKRKEMTHLADVATKEGVVAYGTRLAANLNSVAGEILTSSDKAIDIFNSLEFEGDDDSPLAMPASDFSLL